MANEVLVKQGIQLLFADHATDFGAAPATAANSLIIGAPTDVQMDLTGVAATGGAHQAAKADLTTPWGKEWTVDACLEFETAPADGGVVEFYWAPSPSGTAGTGNPGGTTGTDAAFTDTAGNLGQMIPIGILTVRNDVIAIGHVGILVPTFQYGNLVIVNKASTALRSTATAMDETHIVLTELIDENQ
jgi:hypothetical protein